MRAKTWLKAVMFVAALCVGAMGAGAQQAQQSTGDPVADAARKARADKKEAPKPKKVYTDDDVSKMPPVTTATATDTGAAETPKPADAGKAGGAGESGGAQSEEASWRKKFKDLHEKIAQAEKDLDVLQRESEKSQVQYYADPQKALNEQYSRKDINDKNAKIEAKKQEIAQLKQSQDDMEDALRKAGGDPGWAR